jgi:hydroxymethylpyrimidine pyrophosphatase-like HAD family hydrolase
MGPPPEITALRPHLQEYVGAKATLTQAQGDMVEVNETWRVCVLYPSIHRLTDINYHHTHQVLPPGGSKGAGVQALLKALGVDPQHMLAIGDAENDIEVRGGLNYFCWEWLLIRIYTHMSSWTNTTLQMLKLAGMPVAMGNAPAHIQALAK